MKEITTKYDGHGFSRIILKAETMKKTVEKAFAALTVFSLMMLALMLAACGGGSGSGGVSSQVVSGNAAVGAPLSGQVSLKDSSTPPQQKTTVIGSDGSFGIDVTGLKAPYVLQASGSAAGTEYKLHSFAEGTGTANINPLSNVIVATAAGVDNPSDVFDNADSEKCNKIKTNLAKTVSVLLTKLKPLLKQYNAENTNPITTGYALHLGLDSMFDNVEISLSNGNLSIINTKSKAVIFSGKVSDIANGTFDISAMPATAAVPAVPAGLAAVGGTGQATISWTSVSNATSYNVYYATTSGVTSASGTKIASVSSPYVQTGLAAGTTYFYVVTSVNSAGESAASTQASAGTASTPPLPTVPAAPGGLISAGGTNQVTLSWVAVSTATSYNVYYATAGGVTKANGTKIANASSPVVQGGLVTGTTYYYIVTAVNSTGESAASAQIAATTLATVPGPTAPAAPKSVTAAGGASLATIAWPVVAGATSYNIYYAATAGVTKTNGAKITNAASPYVQSGLAAGTVYYYIVTAVNNAGESAASAQVTATTTAPPALDGLALYNTNCAGCHGTAKLGKSATAIQGAITANTGGMGSLSSLTTAQVAAIATTTAPAPAPAPVLDGAALYNTNCAGCHGTGKRGKTVAAIQGAIASNRGGMGYLSTLSVAQLTAISLY